MTSWTQAFVFMIVLGGLQISLHHRFLTEMRALEDAFVDVRERLAQVETKLGLPTTHNDC